MLEEVQGGFLTRRGGVLSVTSHLIFFSLACFRLFVSGDGHAAHESMWKTFAASKTASSVHSESNRASESRACAQRVIAVYCLLHLKKTHCGHVFSGDTYRTAEQVIFQAFGLSGDDEEHITSN